MSQPSQSEKHLTALTDKLTEGSSLTVEEAREAASGLASPEPSLESKESFLTALSRKGETPDEVFAFAAEFRERAVDPGLDDFREGAIDIVGTGGDGSGTFNFSTAAALLVASIGLPVMKHGNRSITSKSGSADLLADLGVPMENDPGALRKSLEEFGFCFFFAPAFHPAFKEIMPVRKKLAETGTKTIFNLLGPLINPGRPRQQLMGVFSDLWLDPIAGALDQLDIASGMVVHCRVANGAGVDELTTAGTNLVRGVGSLRGSTFPIQASELDLPDCILADLRGGESADNLQMLRDLAQGNLKGPVLDTLCLNAGAALFLSGRSETIPSGIELARTSISDGQFQDWLNRFEKFNHSQS